MKSGVGEWVGGGLVSHVTTHLAIVYGKTHQIDFPVNHAVISHFRRYSSTHCTTLGCWRTGTLRRVQNPTSLSPRSWSRCAYQADDGRHHREKEDEKNSDTKAHDPRLPLLGQAIDIRRSRHLFPSFISFAPLPAV